MEIILIRHTSLAIPKGVCYGQTDVKVSDQFIEEAIQVKAQLAQYDIDTAYTSPLSRCRELASFCGFPTAVADSDLMELNFGDWEMQRWDDIHDPNLAPWYEDWINTRTTNGESFMQQYERYVLFINNIFTKKHKTVAIFTHSGILHCARIYAGIDTFDNTFDFSPAYGEVLVLTL